MLSLSRVVLGTCMGPTLSSAALNHTESICVYIIYIRIIYVYIYCNILWPSQAPEMGSCMGLISLPMQKPKPIQHYIPAIPPQSGGLILGPKCKTLNLAQHRETRSATGQRVFTGLALLVCVCADFSQETEKEKRQKLIGTDMTPRAEIPLYASTQCA